MKTNSPSHDATMLLLSGVMESYRWAAFKPILYSPERLQAWILEKMLPEEEEPRPVDPEDPVIAERAMLSAEAEMQAMEFWGELTPEEREMMKSAFLSLWGKEGAATLPKSYR